MGNYGIALGSTNARDDGLRGVGLGLGRVRYPEPGARRRPLGQARSSGGHAHRREQADHAGAHQHKNARNGLGHAGSGFAMQYQAAIVFSRDRNSHLGEARA